MFCSVDLNLFKSLVVFQNPDKCGLSFGEKMPLAPLSWGSIPLNGPPIQLAICSRRLEPTKLPPGIKYFVWDQIFRGVGEEVGGVAGCGSN